MLTGDTGTDIAIVTAYDLGFREGMKLALGLVESGSYDAARAIRAEIAKREVVE